MKARKVIERKKEMALFSRPQYVSNVINIILKNGRKFNNCSKEDFDKNEKFHLSSITGSKEYF